MSAKEALKPKVGISKKDEKRKAKKEKLTQELAAKEEAKIEARQEEQRQFYERMRQEEIDQQQQAEANTPALMGSKIPELLKQIQEQNAAAQVKKGQNRSQKKKKSTAINNVKAILQSQQFQMNPIATMDAVSQSIRQNLEESQSNQNE